MRPAGATRAERRCCRRWGLARLGHHWLACALLVLFAALPLRAAGESTGAAATGLRFGENGRQTRVVLDLDRWVRFTAEAAADPARLVVDLDDVSWRLPTDAGRPPRGLARGYAVEPAVDGTARLSVVLDGPARVVGAIVLPPSRDSPRFRLVVDLIPEPSLAPAPAAASAPRVPASRPALLATLPAPLARVNGHGAPAAGKRSERPVVVLDPGHGGADPGAISIDGKYEKDLVLDMATELRSLIERSGRYRVVLTREGDEFIRLRDRIAKARRLDGEVFISLHADSLRLAEQRGASIYTLSEKASDAEAARFAAQENKAEILVGADLSQHDAVVATILIDLAQRDTNNKSIAFADVLAEELAQVTALTKRHRRSAGFAVLKSPDIPSVLLELGYLSNAEDARNLAQPDYRAKLGRAIVKALDQYFAAAKR